jgi:hypothetical protein
MRGDRVGVGDIDEMQGSAWGSGDASCGDDDRGAARQYDGSILSGSGLYERHVVSREPGGDRDGVSDSARIEPWACCFDGDGAVRADGMRGDRVGVGDVSAMPCWARGSGDASCGDDGRGAIRQRDCSILNGFWDGERDEGIQQGGDRVGISDFARS